MLPALAVEQYVRFGHIQVMKSLCCGMFQGVLICIHSFQHTYWSEHMSHDTICTFNVSVVAVNGNIVRVGAPYCETYDATRFGARARVFESCKGYVTACFGVR